MPQTLEHLAVLEHLGIEEGIPVVTKADLVEPDWLDLVLAEVAERVARSPVRFEAPLAVSAKTGLGLDELRGRLEARAAALKPGRAADLFRMPVDRAFSVAGVGTVVTGTAWSGRLAIGEAVRLLPSGPSGRVRSIESYGASLEQSAPGARTAVGIAGIQRDQARRGEWLVAADSPWTPVRALDVELALEADDRKARRRVLGRDVHRQPPLSVMPSRFVTVTSLPPSGRIRWSIPSVSARARWIPIPPSGRCSIGRSSRGSACVRGSNGGAPSRIRTNKEAPSRSIATTISPGRPS